MACARVPLDEQQVTEPGPLGKERTLPALVSRLFAFRYFILICGAPLRKNVFFLFRISTQREKRSVFLCLTNPHQKMALLLS